MREEMRILHAEAGEHDLVRVGATVAVGVLEELQIVPVLDVARIARHN